MAKANSEQLLAINRLDGALLSAGAGSGKTFVLTERLLVMCEKWIAEWRPESEPDFSRYIRRKFSQTVLMTFTNKAAGEISIRIHKKMDDHVRNVETNRELWQQALFAMENLVVSTIHGFCFRLIRQGFFPNVNPEDEIISDIEYQKQVSDLFDEWIEDNRHRKDDFFLLLIRERANVFSALKGIIQDPSLRLMWKELDPSSFNRKDIDWAVSEFLKQQDYYDLFESVPDNIIEKFDDKPWFEVLNSFLTLLRSKTEGVTLKFLCDCYYFFLERNFKIPSTPRAKSVPDNLKELYRKIFTFKNFLKDEGEHFLMFEQEGERALRDWYAQFQELFINVESAYSSLPGFTYGDLEYIVCSGLADEKIARRVRGEYERFVVDEFQDTSFIQFRILKRIVADDFSKLYCVGDPKQAIYGFRGGELAVFQTLVSETPLNLSLSHNYRSDFDVIRFNNALFDCLFKLGPDFKGEDRYGVEVHEQTLPETERQDGRVYEIKVDLEFMAQSCEKLSTSDVEYVEAMALAHEIESGVKEGIKTAVLYRKLKPSKMLIQILSAKGISFTSQVKIPFQQDPVIALFKHLIEHEFNTGKLKELSLAFFIKSYARLLKLEEISNERVSALVSFFETDKRYFGTYLAFVKFLERLGVMVSTYDQNLELIKKLTAISHGESSVLLSQMKELEQTSYSLDFQSGQDPGQVVIMSAHASKGLEFPRVLLGGIYTNQNRFRQSGLFGKIPYSFKWKSSSEELSVWKSPHYYLEQSVEKQKEFSESKRLFYVACSRAEHELGWVRIDFNAVPFSPSDGCWASGIDHFLKSDERGVSFKDLISKESRELDLACVIDPNRMSEMDNQPPMFHYDSLGVQARPFSSHLSLLPELSVTRLAQLADCPRKFYLNNSLKLDGQKNDFPLPKEEALPSSSMRRGTLVHEAISSMIINGFSQESFDEQYVQMLSWLKEKLQEVQGDSIDYVSEAAVKFELFGYMISGIPDLIIRDKERTIEIWDFKTGFKTEDVPESYWFQLAAYASNEFLEESIKLKLCFVDTKKIIERTVSLKENQAYLWAYYQKVDFPDEVNVNACEKCSFNKICHGKALASCVPHVSC